MNLLDKIVAWVAPQAGLRRASARARIGFVRKFEGAASGRRYDGWQTTGQSLNSQLQFSLPKLRERSRDLDRNNPWARRGKDSVVANTIGYGITSRLSKGGKAAQKRWNEWADTTACDAAGRANWSGLQALIWATVVVSGECIVMRRWRTGAVGKSLPVPMQIEVLSPDYLDHGKTEALTGGGRIVQGVEFDSQKRRVAYWLFETHPDDAVTFASQSKRVPAKDVLHIFRPEEPDQARGIPWCAPVILTLRDLDDCEDAFLFRQKIANCQVGIITDNGASSAGIAAEEAGLDPLPEKFEPGRFDVLKPGQDIKFNTPPPAGELDPFVRGVLLRVAACFGITFASLTGDLTKVNFSSGRMGDIDQRRNVAQWQWNILVPQLLDPVIAWFGEAYTMSGGNGAGMTAKHGMPRREMINPAQEIGAFKEAIRNGITSLPAVHRELGENTEEVLDEIEGSNKALDAKEIVLDCDPRQDPTRIKAAAPVTQGTANAA